MVAPFKNMRILVTGACGTVGSELLRTLADEDNGLAELVGIDNNESELFFAEQRYLSDPRASFALGDIRDLDVLRRAMHGIDIVFHAAALKHVILCERSPFEAVMTNILGVQNVAAAAREAQVGRVIFTSSDKAVNPTNVMGTSKLMGERLMTAAHTGRARGQTIFASTRFGNVLGSRGSVVPIFLRQIAKGGPVTLTSDEMTRFVMTVGEAASLMIDSALLARGGEVMVTKMPVLRVVDLARAMILEAAPAFGHDPAEIELVRIGAKPGEKYYEELMTDEETARAIELEKYFVILPAFRDLFKSVDYSYEGVIRSEGIEPYVSATSKAMSVEEIRAFLRDNALLSTETLGSHPDRRYWPGDKQ